MLAAAWTLWLTLECRYDAAVFPVLRGMLLGSSFVHASAGMPAGPAVGLDSSVRNPQFTCTNQLCFGLQLDLLR